MCEYCDASSDEENFSPDITVKEMRNGLYHIDLHFGVTGKIGIAEKTFQLCGSHSNRNYIIIYDDENHGNPEENTSGFILIVKEMPCNDPRISGEEIKRGKGKLFVSQDVSLFSMPSGIWSRERRNGSKILVRFAQLFSHFRRFAFRVLLSQFRDAQFK
jgi:hypothetical protein